MEGQNIQSGEQSEMKIYLKVMKTIAINGNSLDTIEDIKAKVCAIEGVGFPQQELFFADNHLKDTTKSLADYNIPTNSTINLYIRDGMQIYVNFTQSRKTITLQVNNWDTIQRVKAEIQDKEGIPPERQVICYLGRSLQDSQTLGAYDIRHDSILQVALRPVDELQIFVIMKCGKRITLDVRTWFTVLDVKLMIESMEGVPAIRQVFVFAGRNLEDALTLAECEVTNKSILKLAYSMQLLVKTWSGKTLTVMVYDYDTITTTMEKIERKIGSIFRSHYLSYAGKHLQKERTLGYYKICSGSTVHLLVRAPSWTFI